MAGAADSDATVQTYPILGQSHGLGQQHTSTQHSDPPNDTSLAWPTLRLSEELSEGTFFAEAFVSPAEPRQYEYPPPVAAYNYQPLPYPDPSTRASEQIAACFVSRDERVGASPNFVPAQAMIAVDLGYIDPCLSVRDDSGLGSSFGPDSPRAAPDTERANCFPSKSQGCLQHGAGTEGLTKLTSNLFQDDSTPYIPGGSRDWASKLEQRTETLAAIVDQASFLCKPCNKHFKDKSSLDHHTITHDGYRKHRHKCTTCGSGFRYPKDLKRHAGAVHGETVHGEASHACGDCDKVYKRKDHLKRHLESQRHTASSEITSVHLEVPGSADQQNHVSQPISSSPYRRQGYTGHHYHNPHQVRDQLGNLGTHLEPSYALETLTSQSLLDIPRAPFGYASTGSIDETLSFSDVDSFQDDDLDILQRSRLPS